MSPKSAGLAVKMGYSNVKVYLQGNPGWEESGRALVASDSFVLDGNIVLVDLRAPEKARKAHIPRAVNIPFAKLEESWEQFPKNRAAPIVFYGDQDEAAKAVAMVKEWGYRKLSVVEGGFERWQKSGRPVAKGELTTQVNWVRKLGPGEVATEEFRKVLAERPADKIVLDVRQPSEVAGGMFPGAINIPLDELEGRLGEIPPGKEVLIHCATGARAEMARQTLVKAGIPARYCMVDVKCQEGECFLDE